MTFLIQFFNVIWETWVAVLTSLTESCYWNYVVADMASWREGGRPAAVSENTPDDRVQQTDSLFADKCSASVSATSAGTTDDLQKQAYMMANSQHYPPFHGPLPPPYVAMRPSVKPPAMGPMPFHMSQMSMMPPNYNAMMMPHFVCTFSLFC